MTTCDASAPVIPTSMARRFRCPEHTLIDAWIPGTCKQTSFSRSAQVTCDETSGMVTRFYDGITCGGAPVLTITSPPTCTVVQGQGFIGYCPLSTQIPVTQGYLDAKCEGSAISWFAFGTPESCTPSTCTSQGNGVYIRRSCESAIPASIGLLTTSYTSGCTGQIKTASSNALGCYPSSLNGVQSFKVSCSAQNGMIESYPSSTTCTGSNTQDTQALGSCSTWRGAANTVLSCSSGSFTTTPTIAAPAACFCNGQMIGDKDIALLNRGDNIQFNGESYMLLEVAHTSDTMVDGWIFGGVCLTPGHIVRHGHTTGPVQDFSDARCECKGSRGLIFDKDLRVSGSAPDVESYITSSGRYIWLNNLVTLCRKLNICRLAKPILWLTDSLGI